MNQVMHASGYNLIKNVCTQSLIVVCLIRIPYGNSTTTQCPCSTLNYFVFAFNFIPCTCWLEWAGTAGILAPGSTLTAAATGTCLGCCRLGHPLPCHMLEAHQYGHAWHITTMATVMSTATLINDLTMCHVTHTPNWWWLMPFSISMPTSISHPPHQWHTTITRSSHNPSHSLGF